MRKELFWRANRATCTPWCCWCRIKIDQTANPVIEEVVFLASSCQVHYFSSLPLIIKHFSVAKMHCESILSYLPTWLMCICWCISMKIATFLHGVVQLYYCPEPEDALKMMDRHKTKGMCRLSPDGNHELFLEWKMRVCPRFSNCYIHWHQEWM